jgi:hypothetical protein
MREIRTFGSARGAARKGRPYRDRAQAIPLSHTQLPRWRSIGRLLLAGLRCDASIG